MIRNKAEIVKLTIERCEVGHDRPEISWSTAAAVRDDSTLNSGVGDTVYSLDGVDRERERCGTKNKL